MKTYCNKDCGNKKCEFNLNNLKTNETALYEEKRNDCCGYRELEVIDGQTTT